MVWIGLICLFALASFCTCHISLHLCLFPAWWFTTQGVYMVTCLHNKAEDQDSWSFARISQNKKKNLFHELHGSLGSKKITKNKVTGQEPFVQQNWGVVYFDLLFLLFSFTLPAGEQDRHHLGICNLAPSDNQMWNYPWQVLWNALEICCLRSNMVWDCLGCFGVASFQEIPRSSIILGESKRIFSQIDASWLVQTIMQHLSNPFLWG